MTLYRNTKESGNGGLIGLFVFKRDMKYGYYHGGHNIVYIYPPRHFDWILW